MITRSKLVPLIIISVMLLTSTIGYATGLSTPNIQIGNSIYRDLDKLIAWGLVSKSIYGQRPWSRNEAARMVAEALRRVSEGTQPEDIAIHNTIKHLRSEFIYELRRRGDLDDERAPAVRMTPLQSVQATYTLLDSPFSLFPSPGAGGSITALLNPLAEYQQGRLFVDGQNLGLQTTTQANLSRFFSLSANPEFRGLIAKSGGGSRAEVVVNELYGRLWLYNFSLTAGRQPLLWGQEPDGGLLISDNARPLDALHFTNDSPIILPWIFKYLGASKFTFFAANLGPEQTYPYSYLYGIKISFKPCEIFEVGFSETLQTGGRNSGFGSFTDVVHDLFPINKAGQNNLFAVGGNHQFGLLDFRLTLPFLRNTILYWDSQFEDSPLRATDDFTDLANQMSFVSGVFIPRLTNDGSISLDLSYHHTSVMAYEHSYYTTGYTLNRQIIGDPLGPESDGAYITLGHDISKNLFHQEKLAFENRRSDIFTSAGGPFSKIANGTTDRRYRFSTNWRWNIKDSIILLPTFGVERATNWGFVQGRNRTNVLFELSLRINLENWNFSYK